MDSIKKADRYDFEDKSAPSGDPPTDREGGAPGKPAERNVQLDLKELHAQGFITPDVPRSQAAEEYRLLKRPILKRAFKREMTSANERSNLIMVTSALVSEGKTFTALNLAMSMAMEYDHTVLFVDADVIKPHATRLMGLENKPGLVDVISNPELDLSNAIFHTNVPNLRVVPAGQFHSLSTELLASQQMDKLAGELSRRYPERIIIFDTSPLLATTQPSVLTHILGQIIVVVRAEHTPSRAVKEALTYVDRARPVWLVLNKSHEGFGIGYSRYSYYGYG